jgi:hypothetical protein
MHDNSLLIVVTTLQCKITHMSIAHVIAARSFVSAEPRIYQYLTSTVLVYLTGTSLNTQYQQYYDAITLMEYQM